MTGTVIMVSGTWALTNDFVVALIGVAVGAAPGSIVVLQIGYGVVTITSKAMPISDPISFIKTSRSLHRQDSQQVHAARRAR